MAQPIYHLVLMKFVEAWYQLSQEERDSLLAKVIETMENVGGKTVIGCYSRWSSEQWPYFGVQEYPDIEAYQKNVEALEELNWFRYVDAMTVNGTEWKPSYTPPTLEQPMPLAG